MPEIYIYNHTKRQHIITKSGLTPKLKKYIKKNWKDDRINYETFESPPKKYTGNGYYVDGMLCFETFKLPLYKKKSKK